MDKIKIYLPKKIADILDKDAEAFEFFKRDGITVNRNALLTKLILNYGEAFARERSKLTAAIREHLGKTEISDGQASALCARLAETLYARDDGEGKLDAVISLKPTSLSESAIEYTENYLLDGRSLSEYFRGMITSYASLPQDRRETIIFRPQYEAIRRAITEKKKVFLTTVRDSGFEISPYEIVGSKEEMHLYVIGMRGSCTTFRLSRIKGVKILGADAEISQAQIEVALKMIKYGPQFYYGANEEEVCVRLTPKGMEKWKRIYVHRPIPDRVEENLMFFNCSHVQIIQYFLRFGADAEILRPVYMRRELLNFYTAAAKIYSD